VRASSVGGAHDVRAVGNKFPVKALAVVPGGITKGWLIQRGQSSTGQTWYQWRDVNGGNLWTMADVRWISLFDSDRGINWALGWEGEEADAFRVYRGLTS
jgi:hypothetical protein